MHLKQTRRNGRIYLSVVQNYRDGGTTKTKTIESIGYADTFADQYPDPIAHFKAYVDQLNEKRRRENAPIVLSLRRDAHIEPGRATSVQLGEGIALAYLDAFGVGTFFNDRARARGIDVDMPGRSFELFCAARILHAAPKHETWQSRESFPRRCPESFAEAYLALPLFAQESRALIAHLNRTYAAIRGQRDVRCITLVLSNYVFRAASGSTFEGAPEEASTGSWLRLCVVVDNRGIPLTYRIVPRTITEQHLKNLVASVKKETGTQQITLAAGRLPNATAIARTMVEGGDNFVLMVPPEDRDAKLTDWIADGEGYRDIKKGIYALKSRRTAIELSASDADGHPRKLPICQLALRSMRTHTLSPESADSRLCIMTNYAEASDRSIFNVYRELWRVHEPFQVIDADFISPPYPVPMGIHLDAHFAISYAAFFLLRVMREDMGWAYNAATVADALMQLEGAYLTENWYVFNYRTDVTDTIEKAAGVSVGRRVMSRDDIRHEIARAKRHIRREDGEANEG